MSAAIHDSSPPRFTAVVADGAKITSSSFTPPAGALLVLGVQADMAASGGVLLEITDTKGLTWTKRGEVGAYPFTTGLVAVYTAINTTATAMTVSIRRTTSGFGEDNRISGKVMVYTGANAVANVGQFYVQGFTPATFSPYSVSANGSLPYAAVFAQGPGSGGDRDILQGEVDGEVSYESAPVDPDFGAMTVYGAVPTGPIGTAVAMRFASGDRTYGQYKYVVMEILPTVVVDDNSSSSSSSSSTEQSVTSSSSTVASVTSSSSSSSLIDQSLLGLAIFEWPINWSNPVNAAWNFDLRTMGIGFGPELDDPKQEHIIHGWEFECEFQDEDVVEVELFLDRLLGRTKPFWLPGPSAAFRITDPDSENSSSSSSADDDPTVFQILEQGAATSWELHPGRWLYFTRFSGEYAFGKIAGITDLGDGTERVVLDRALDEVLDSSWQCFPLALVRLADDRERCELMAERKVRRQFKVVEVPHEYAQVEAAGIPEPEQPVFLYEFAARLPDGDITWRFTSHPSDFTIADSLTQSSSSSTSSGVADNSSSSSSSSLSSGSSSSSSTLASNTSSSSSSSNNSSSSSTESADGSSSSSESQSSSSSSASSSSSFSSESSSSSSNSHTSSSSSEAGTTQWLAVGINHSGLSRSAKFGGTVTITADVDSVEPLRLLVPLRLAGQLRLRIYKTTINATEPVMLFDGAVRRPKLTGRKIQATGVEWGDALENPVPAFFIQRNCNYRVYDPHTCRHLRSRKELTVSVIGRSGRTLLVEAAQLAGVAADWYAFGWLELGSGLTQEILYVVSSSEASGNRVTLTTSAPYRGELPGSGVLLPGCDGRRSTCISKFNNLDNFGGHATPRTNLTLQAIKVTTEVGKK